MKLSKYNIIKKIDDKGYLVFNTLYCSLVLIRPSDYEDFININPYNKLFEVWKKEKLITDLDDEYSNFLSGKNLDEKMQILTIFTTTACNARCEYCFEQGIKPMIMTRDIAQKIAYKIIDNIRTNKLHITWFGGEPLLNTSAIDIITNIVKPFCIKNNIKFTSSIITNGSLINDDITKKMVEKWEIKAIQISFDGIYDDYNNIKKYVDKSDFNKVVSNIKKLVEAKLNINIRVNFSKQNFSNTIKVIKFFYDNNLFSNKINIYFAPISGETNYVKKSEISKMYDMIFEQLYLYGYLKNIKYFHFNFSMHHCQAGSKYSYSIFPDGKIAKCQRERPECSSVSIFDDDFLTELNNDWIAKTGEDSTKVCQNCAILPICGYGCRINNFETVSKMHCSKCYMYKDAFDSIIKILGKCYIK